MFSGRPADSKLFKNLIKNYSNYFFNTSETRDTNNIFIDFQMDFLMILSGATILYESYSFNSRDSCSFFVFVFVFHSAFRDCGAYTGYARTELLFSSLFLFKSKVFYKHFW